MSSTRELRKLEKEFRKIPHARAAVAYGSAVRGDKFTGSDIDVAVFTEGYYLMPPESYYHMSKMPKEYDITPHSVGETNGLISDFFNEGFYEHFINYSRVIFDDDCVMKNIEKIGERRKAFEEKVSPNREHAANICYYLLRTRRGCVNLGKWLPKYGLIEPIVKDLDRFKSSLMGVMREGIRASGQSIEKGSDYKECVISKFAKTYPRFWNENSKVDDEPQFQMRSWGYRGFDSNPAYISAHIMSSDEVWHNLRRISIRSVLKQANECRKLIEYATACVNDELMKKISS
jgi:predicted nucleotidyltransferase